jgi:IS5 family transposase
VFDAVNRQLAKHGYIARDGQMIDTSIVQAPRQSLSKEEKAIVSEGAMPADWMPAKRRQKDMDARWRKKHGKSYFGYKVTANADKRYKLVRKIKVSMASEHDIMHFEDVLDPANTNRDILADKGYVDGEREARHSDRSLSAGDPALPCQPGGQCPPLRGRRCQPPHRTARREDHGR